MMLRHPLEERAVVRHDHEPAAVTIEEPLEQLEPGEVEVVRRLVEQEHVGVGGEDRLELRPRGLAARAAPRSPAPARDTRRRAPGGSRLTVPESGASSPASTRRSVDLPIPFGPTTPIRLPGVTVSEMRSRTTVSPKDLLIERAASTPRARGMG